MENKVNFRDILRNRNGKALFVKFGATWCGPCKALQPILEEISEEWQDYMDVVSIDVDDDPDLANYYKIRSVPTMMLFDDEGDFLGRLGGMHSKAVISRYLMGFYS